MSLQLVITNAGRAALVAAGNTGTKAVTIASAGVTGAAFAPTAATTALPVETKRIATLSGSAVDADTVHLTVRDESADVYTVRGIGLYLTDGTLFAAYGQSGVIAEKAMQALLLLAIDVRFVDVPAAQIRFGDANFLNPPATEATAGVVELATAAETVAGTDDRRAVHPRGLKAAFGSMLGYVPANRAGDTFTGNVDGSFRATTQYAPTSGAGVELIYTGNVGYLQSYDRSANAYRNLVLSGSNVALRPQGGGAIALEGPTIVSGSLTRSGNTVWDAANDGAGSGSDADLLDGQHGSWYTDIAGRLGFTPLDAAAFTGAAVVQRLGFTPANRAGDTFTGNVDGSFRATTQYAPTSGAGLELAFTGNVGFVQSYDRSANAYRNLVVSGSNVALRPQGGGAIALEGPTVVSGSLTRSGNTVWDAANDGAGSGSDADLLDGQHGSWYADIAGRLGFTPLDVAAFTGAAVVQRLGFTPANRAGDTFTGNVDGSFRATTQYSPTSGAGLELMFAGNIGYVQSYDRSAGTYRSVAVTGTNVFLQPQGGAVYSQGPLRIDGAITRYGNTVWDSANDGAGSGCDADLLDGQQGSWYADVRARLGYDPLPAASYTAPDVLAKLLSVDGAGSGLDADLLDGLDSSDFDRVTENAIGGASGYRVHADGFKECWGVANIPANQTALVPLPIPHSAWVHAVGSSAPVDSNDERNVGVSGPYGEPPVGFYVRSACNSPTRFYWHTRGV